MVIAILIFISMIVATVLYDKKVKTLNTKRLQFGWLNLYALIPLTIYYLNELFISKEQELFVVILKTPSIFLFYLSFIWLFSNNRKDDPFVITFVKIGLFMGSFMFYSGSMVYLSIMPQVTILENPTDKERMVIENRYNVTLPEKIEDGVALFGMSFLQGSEYYVVFEMKESDWNKYKPSLQVYYKVKPSKIEGNVVVKIYGSEKSTADYSELFYKNASLWNFVKYKFNH